MSTRELSAQSCVIGAKVAEGHIPDSKATSFSQKMTSLRASWHRLEAPTGFAGDVGG